jgi:hypothetical protein
MRSSRDNRRGDDEEQADPRIRYPPKSFNRLVAHYQDENGDDIQVYSTKEKAMDDAMANFLPTRVRR